MPTTIASRTDAQLTADVIRELKWDPRVDETEVGVRVRDGIVTLTGHVGAYPKKLAARDAAHRVYGVLDVVDEITVRLPALLVRTDEDIAKAVRSTLKWDVLVRDDQITTTVSNGIVTLNGTVDSWSARHDVEQAVYRLTGVRSVVNQITVGAVAIDAARIKQEIEDALERRAEREAKRIGVSVRDGVVTLTGTLRSWGEKNAVERVASYACGVRRIDDRTTVDPYM